MSSSSSSLNIASMPKFDGSNWTVWSAGIKAHLQFLNLNDYAFTVVATPTDPAELLKHEQNIKKTAALILLTMDNALWHLIKSKDDPKAQFDILKAKYEKAGALTAFSYFDKLFGTKFSEGESMVTQLADLDRLRNEANTAGITLTDAHYVLLILCSLPSSYSTLFTALLSTAGLSKVPPGDVSSRIIDEYTRRSSDPSMAAMKPHTSSHIHTSSKKFDGECNYCQKRGHRERDCRKKKGDKGKKKAAPSVSVLSTKSI